MGIPWINNSSEKNQLKEKVLGLIVFLMKIMMMTYSFLLWFIYEKQKTYQVFQVLSTRFLFYISQK